MFFILNCILSQALAEEVPHLGKDGAERTSPLSLAVVGDLCTGSLFSTDYCPVTLGIINDMRSEQMQSVVFLGDIVQSPKKKTWSKQITSLLKETAGMSVSALPGHTEYKDKVLTEFGDVFGDSKYDIGFNRFAGWQHLRVKDGSAQWTLFFLDSHKKEMGARWGEQKQWLSELMENNKDQIIVFLDQPPRELSGKSHAPSQELLDMIYERTGLSQVRLVAFSGGNHLQTFLPDTSFDALYLGCGAGGAKASSLQINNTKLDIKLHPLLHSYFIQKVGEGSFDEKTSAQLMATGDYQGKSPLLSAKDFPVFGWCGVELNNGLHVTQRHTLDGTDFSQALELSFTKVKGWTKTVKVSPPAVEESQEEPK